ncbi:MAG: adenylate/guanylate cyclase domain-containing protein [Elusimicrobia bacterium]|nr:adenylate/guanylate cyclase domain-containing protein [Candidatus Liberimonas magnetica]
MEKKKIISLAISSGVGLFVLFLWMFSALDMWENKITNSHFTRRGLVEPSDKIAIVAVDEESINKLGRWPWARSVHANLINKLTALGAKAIVFDVLFTEADKEKPLADEQLGKAAKKSGKVVFGCFFQTDQSGAPVKSLEPIESIKKDTRTGFVNIFTELDGVNRKVSLVMDFENDKIPSLSLAGLSLYLNQKPEDIIKERKIAVDEFNEMIVNFSGGYESFPYYSFSKVLNGEIPAEKIKDKIILVGGTAAGLFDFKAIPFVPIFPGVEIHANAMSNILLNNYLRQWPGICTFILIIIFALLSGMVFGQFAPWKGGVTTVIVFIGYFVFTYYMFKIKYVLAEFVAPAASLSLSYVGVLFYRFMTEEKEKRWIKKSFSTYLNPHVLEEIIKDPASLKLGGQKQNLSILFSDIRGFTTISESLSPEGVVELLNEYLTKMVEVVFRHEGTLDKFIGDAVMAFWGAPIPQKDHARKAVMCGIEMVEELEKLQAKWQAEGKTIIKIGVGINSGNVIVGNMGSMERMDYTVIGDDVNLASRLESLNKEYKTVMIISEETYKQVEDLVEAKPLGGVKVKGKAKAVNIYGVFGRKGAPKEIFELHLDENIKKAYASTKEPPKEKEKENKKFNPDERMEFPKK